MNSDRPEFSPATEADRVRASTRNERVARKRGDALEMMLRCAGFDWTPLSSIVPYESLEQPGVLRNAATDICAACLTLQTAGITAVGIESEFRPDEPPGERWYIRRRLLP